MHASFVIVTGGSPPHEGVVARLPEDRFVIAADSGLDHAAALGIGVDLVVGDLDSVSEEGLRVAEAAGVPIERHPVDKDATDTELALAAALERGATHVVVVAGGGDRLDHLLATLLVLTHPMAARATVEAWVGAAHVLALQGPAQAKLDGAAGAFVSLIPVAGDADGVVTEGLRFPLRGERLPAATTRGVSNELTGGPALVALDRGALVVVVPDALGGPA
jgi:thiamine pyrophosphokinase